MALALLLVVLLAAGAIPSAHPAPLSVPGISPPGPFTAPPNSVARAGTLPTAMAPGTAPLGLRGAPFAPDGASPGFAAMKVNLTATPTRGTIPLTVAFQAQATSVGGGTVFNFSWNFSDGSPNVTDTHTVPSGSTSTSNETHTFVSVGKFVVAVRVSDGGVDAAVTNRTPVTTAIPLAVSASVTKTVLDVGGSTSVLLNLSGGFIPYVVTWSSPVSAGCVRSGLYYNCAPKVANSSLPLQANVTDNAGDRATWVGALVVNPAIVLRTYVQSWFQCNGGLGALRANFSALVSGGTAPIAYNWSFGDGAANATTLNATHPYSLGPTYLVQMQVNDPTGASMRSNLSFVSSFGGCGSTAPPNFSPPTALLELAIAGFALFDVALAVLVLRSRKRPPRPAVPAAAVRTPETTPPDGATEGRSAPAGPRTSSP